jgi:hypothetical protein
VSSTRAKAKAGVGLVGYLVWALFAYIDPTARADFLKFNIGCVVGVVGLILRDMPHTPSQPPKDPP